MADFLSDHYLPWILGLGFSVVGGHLAIAPTMRIMWRAIGYETDSKLVRPFSWQPAAQGFVERALFTIAILIGQPGFVAVWLVLKSASQWSSLIGSERLKRQAVHVNYVLGTGLSIGFAAAGAFVVELLQAQRLTPAFLVASSTVAATAALALWVRGPLPRSPVRC